MKKRLFTVVAFVSMLGFLFSVAISIRVWKWGTDVVSFMHSKSTQADGWTTFTYIRGDTHFKVFVLEFTWGKSSPKGWYPSGEGFYHVAFPYMPGEDLIAQKYGMTWWQEWGSSWRTRNINTVDEQRTEIRIDIPYWMMIIGFAILPIVWVVKRRRSKQQQDANVCPVCGYDLRATPDRCPECGTESHPQQPASS